MKYLVTTATLVFISFMFLGCGSSTTTSTDQQRVESLAFGDWADLQGLYTLKSFEGADTKPRESEFKIETDRYFSMGGRLTVLNMDLYDSYSAAGSHNWNFGPMKEIGVSSVVRSGDSTIFIYDCKSESIFNRGQMVKLSLHIEAKRTNGSPDLEIQYTLQTASSPPRSHRFVLTRSRP